MDTLWLFILQATQAVMDALNALLDPVNSVHPMLSILLLAVCTVLLVRFLRKHLVTKRYLRLQEEFRNWYHVREEALSAHSDPEKAKCLARNIDKATLNKVYYDYFFEGLLLNLVTTYLPILCMAGYINEAYKPERLQVMLGTSSLVSFPAWLHMQGQINSLLFYAAVLTVLYPSVALGSSKIKILWKRWKRPQVQAGPAKSLQHSPDTAPLNGEAV